MPLTGRPTKALVRHALKTALAAVICMAITNFMGLKYGYWAVISSVIVMQSDLGGSLRAARIRITGTFVGGLVGVLFLNLLPASPVTLGTAIFLTIVLSGFLIGMQESFRMACITAAIVILAWDGAVPAHEFAFRRLMEILLGVVVGLSVSIFVWPAMATSKLRNALAEELRDGAVIVRQAVACFLDGAEEPSPGLLEKIRDKLRTNRELCLTARREHLDPRRRRQRFLLVLATVERMMDYVQALADTAARAHPDGYQSQLRPEIGRAGEECARFMELLADSFCGLKVEEEFPRLDQSVADIRTRILGVRQTGAGARFSVDDVMTSFSFFSALRALADLLDRTAGDLWASDS